MKKGWLSLITILLLGLVFATVGVLTAADVPDKIIIDNKGYKKDTRPPVPLTHKKHHDEYGVACADCHHEYKDGQNVWKEGDPVKKCIDCHDPEKTDGNVLNLQNSFHRNCRDCHKDVSGQGKDAPFKKCTDCHQK